MPEIKTTTSQIHVPADFALTEADIRFVLDLAVRAGTIAVAMRAGATVEEKTSATDLVTSADKALSELIVKELSERFPNDVVLSEEAPWHSTNDGKRRWIVDPIDGTKYYVDGTGKYCVMIGLEQAGRELFGCFYMPAYNQALFGGPGLGTYRYVGASAPTESTATLSKVEALPALASQGKVRLLISKNDLAANSWVSQLPDVEIVVASSIGIDVYELLIDKADVFVHIRPTLGYWDTAAPGPVSQGLGFDVGTEVDDFISYGYESSKHLANIVIGKKGSLAWWRQRYTERPQDGVTTSK
ncbi:MAG: inositol monophosphatase family protein [Candidatus Obscuribacterales bacterium]|jgi:3'-phosphoadenosine 5'-phosphosulfate (PAPS) 3'-phosphatase